VSIAVAAEEVTVAEDELIKVSEFILISPVPTVSNFK